MSLGRRLKENPTLLRIVAVFMAIYLRFVFATSRITLENAHMLAPAQAGRAPFIAAFWHGRFLGPAYIFRRFRTRAQVLISNHGDGEIIAQTIQALGYTAIRGSTDRDKRGELKDKGGSAGLRTMIRALKAGNTVGLTPDGPRGPRMRVTPGVVTLAQLSGAPLVPLAWSSSRGIQFQSWDRFLLPLPFGRIIMELGNPMTVPRHLDEASFIAVQTHLEETLNALCDACDTRVGRPHVAPGPAPSRERAA